MFAPDSPFSYPSSRASSAHDVEGEEAVDDGFGRDAKYLSVACADGLAAIAVLDVLSGKVTLYHQQMDKPPHFHKTRSIIENEDPTMMFVSDAAPKELKQLSAGTMLNDSSLSEFMSPDGHATGSLASAQIKGRESSSGIVSTPASSVTGASSEHEEPPSKKSRSSVSNSDLQSSILIKVVPRMNFNYEKGMQNLMMMNIAQGYNNASNTAKFSFLSGRIAVEEKVTMSALFGLITSLDAMNLNNLLPNDLTSLFNRISYAFSKNQLYVNENTREALSVVQTLYHPSSASARPTKKEGFSLFGMFNKCASSGGQALLKSYFMNPINDLEVLKYRSGVVKIFSATVPNTTEENAAETNANKVSANEAQNFYSVLRKSIGKVRCLRPIWKRMKFSSATASDWLGLHNSLYHILEIAKIIEANELAPVSWKTRIADFLSELQSIEEAYDLICNYMDVEATHETGSFVVKVGVDQSLDDARKLNEKQEEHMNNAHDLERQYFLMNNLQVHNGMVTYFPQLGHFFVVPLDESLEVDKLRHNGYTRAFVSGPHVYYKTPATRGLDEEIGDPQIKIEQIQTMLIIQLEEQISAAASPSLILTEFCSEVDCLSTIGNQCLGKNYVEPQFTEDGVIDIKKGRHPLLDVSGDFVKNNYLSGPDAKVKVITGPNMSGKSVYMKQIGLIVYMAHIGCMVPAESAKMPLIDKIFSRMKNSEQVSSGMSSFATDVQQIAQATKEATPNSLIIIDEFGKGTEPKSGVALLAGTIRYFLNNSPHVLVATHFHSVVKHLPDHPQLQFHKMSTERVNEEFEYTYKVVAGRAESSLAYDLAEKEGMPDHLVDRMKEVTLAMDTGRKPDKMKPAVENRAHQAYTKHEEFMIGLAKFILSADISSDRKVVELFAEMKRLKDSEDVSNLQPAPSDDESP